MRKKIITGFLILAATGFIIYLLTKVDFSSLKQISTSALVLLLLLSILFVIGYSVARTLILRGMGSGVNLKDVFLIITASTPASYIGNFALGISTRVLMYNYFLNVPISVGSAAVVIETVLWFTTMGIIVSLPMAEVWGGRAWILSIGIFVFEVLGIVFLFNITKIKKALPEKTQKKLAKIIGFIENFYASIRSLPLKVILMTSIVLICTYLIDAVLLYISLKQFGYQSNIYTLMYISVFAYLAGFISLIPMGLGSREASFVYLLTRIGIPEDIAITVTLIQRVFKTVVPLLLGLISINILGVDRFKKMKPSKTIEN